MTGVEEAEVELFSRLMRIGAEDLPENQSLEERAGSEEGTGGKRSAWKDSDCNGNEGQASKAKEKARKAHLARDAERDRLNGVSDGLVSASDLGLADVDSSRGGETHAALRLRARVVGAVSRRKVS